MSKKTYKLIVKGRVQGVGFRYYVSEIAPKYDAKGYVRNLPDGTVEIYVTLEQKNFPNFLQMIQKGPIFSRVDDVEITPIEPPMEFDDFKIRF